MWEPQETQVPSLSQEDPLEKEMATHSNILAWEIPWTEEAGGLQSIGLQQLGVTKHLSMHACITVREVLVPAGYTSGLRLR